MRWIVAATAFALGGLAGYFVHETVVERGGNVPSAGTAGLKSEARESNAQAGPSLLQLERQLRAVQARLDEIADLVGKNRADTSSVQSAVESEKLRGLIVETWRKAETDREKKSLLLNVDQSIKNSRAHAGDVDASQEFRDDAREHLAWLENFRARVEPISDWDELKDAIAEMKGQ